MKIIFRPKLLNLKLLIVPLLSLTLLACGGGNSESESTLTPRQVAIDKIKSYARTGVNPPALQVYISAGVTGVNVTNLEQVNAYIKTLNEDDVDTVSELEEITTALTTNIQPTVNAGVDITTQVNQPILITGIASDSDGSIVKYEWKVGTTVLASTPSFSYSSISLGANILTLTVTDNQGGTASDSIIVMVTSIQPINHAPTAISFSAVLRKDTKANIPLVGSDRNNDQLTYTVVNQPAHGSVSVNGHIAVYTPAQGFTGNDNFSYQVNDGKLDSNIATVEISIHADNQNPNHAPVANSVKVNIIKNTSEVITLGGSDSDGDTLSYHLTGYPAHGVVTLSANTATYTPTQGFTGIDSFSYRVNDGKVDSATANVFIQINDYPQYTKSFTTAKKQAAEIYLAHQEAFYSGCEYYAVGKKLIPLKDTCGFQTRKDEVRASRIEWEHVVSMWAMAHDFECWQNGGRSNCKTDHYRQIETDLHNLVPSIGEINADRSNYPHGIIAGEPRIYGFQVDAEVDFKASIFEPKEDVRGDIARMYFYMQQKYGLSISSNERQLYQSWDKCDPVDNWENERNLAIEAIQGNANPFVTNYVYDASSCTAGGGSGGSTGGSTGGSNQSCDSTKKYCSHMDSCSDAYYYLNQCGRTRLDGDKDGVPCEALCR